MQQRIGQKGLSLQGRGGAYEIQMSRNKKIKEKMRCWNIKIEVQETKYFTQRRQGAI